MRSTIVVPVWDAYVGARLDAALSSLAAQSTPAALVIVDNYSQVAPPPLDDSRPPGLVSVQLVRTERRLTLGAARNVGLAAARTPYVMFWDADDLMLPRTLELLQRRLDDDQRLIAAAAAIYEQTPGGDAGRYRRHRWPRPWVVRLLARPRLAALVDCVWSVYPTTGATLMRRAAAVDAGGFADAGSGEDWALGVALMFRGQLAFSERPGRLYRRDPSSTWSQHSDAAHQRAHARTVRQRIRDDAAVPRRIKAALPLIALAQLGAIDGQRLLRRLRATLKR